MRGRPINRTIRGHPAPDSWRPAASGCRAGRRPSRTARRSSLRPDSSCCGEDGDEDAVTAWVVGHVGPPDGGDFRPPHHAHKQQPRDGVGAAPRGGHLIGLAAAAPTESLGVPTGLSVRVCVPCSFARRLQDIESDTGYDTRRRVPVNLHRTLTFQKADRVRNAVLRGNAQAEMHVVRHRLPFEQLDAPLVAQRPQNPSDLLAQLAVQNLPPKLRNDDHVIFAFPPYVPEGVFARVSQTAVGLNRFAVDK